MLHTPTSKANPGSPSMAERDAGSWFLTKDNLLTTPCADDTGLRTERYQQGGTALSMQVAAMEGMLPTPRAIYGEHPGMTDPKHLTGAAMLPTPRHEGHDAGAHRGQPDSLHSYAKMHPTPCERDFRTGMADRSWNPNRTQNLPERTAADLGMVSAKLNPDWVSRMMGYPDGWMDVGEATP
jgi:hypothetical protein